MANTTITPSWWEHSQNDPHHGENQATNATRLCMLLLFGLPMPVSLWWIMAKRHEQDWCCGCRLFCCRPTLEARFGSRESSLILDFCFETSLNLDVICEALLTVRVIRAKIPYVRLPKPGAIPPLPLFWLYDSSFESPWQLKLHDTSLNLQRGLVVEILASQVVRSKVTTNDYLLSFNFRICKWFKITDWSVPTDFVLLEGAWRKSNPSLASIVMLCTELSTAWRLSMKFFGMTDNYSRGLQIMLPGRWLITQARVVWSKLKANYCYFR